LIYRKDLREIFSQQIKSKVVGEKVNSLRNKEHILLSCRHIKIIRGTGKGVWGVVIGC
jgi:hypothetical protein